MVRQVRTVTDSPILSVSQCVCLYNAPYFGANDPETRNNRQITANGTNYWTLHGRHETKVGYEWYRSQRTGGNSQSPTQYVFNADFVADASGKPVLDSTGRPIPMFVPGVSFDSYFPAVIGAVINIDTSSVFVQDHWAVNSRWSADLGARFEHLSSDSTGSITGMTSAESCRDSAAAYDVSGNGNHIVHITYGQYRALPTRTLPVRIARWPIRRKSTPSIRDLRDRAMASRRASPWATTRSTRWNSAVPIRRRTSSSRQAQSRRSAHEFSLSYGMNVLNGRGYFEGSYIARVTHDLIDDSKTLQGGTTNVVVNGVSAGTSRM